MDFKKFLDDNNCKYNYYGEHNVLSINFEDANNRKEVRNAITELCTKFGYINGVRITGKAVLEVSSNPDIIREMGFESEEFKL